MRRIVGVLVVVVFGCGGSPSGPGPDPDPQQPNAESIALGLYVGRVMALNPVADSTNALYSRAYENWNSPDQNSAHVRNLLSLVITETTGILSMLQQIETTPALREANGHLVDAWRAMSGACLVWTGAIETNNSALIADANGRLVQCNAHVSTYFTALSKFTGLVLPDISYPLQAKQKAQNAP